MRRLFNQRESALPSLRMYIYLLREANAASRIWILTATIASVYAQHLRVRNLNHLLPGKHLFFLFFFVTHIYQRDASFIKKLQKAIDDAVNDIPYPEDAVVEVFLGYRKRNGDMTVKKYVFMLNIFTISDHFS